MVLPSRILIVEDEEILADNLRVFLGRYSSDVRIAHDAATAMEILKSFAPDLVVLDYSLPGIDGLRVYADIVRMSLQKPSCVMITGNPTAFIVQSAHRQGIRHVLCKPFSFAELLHAIKFSGDVADSPVGIFSEPPPRGASVGSNRRLQKAAGRSTVPIPGER